MASGLVIALVAALISTAVATSHHETRNRAAYFTNNFPHGASVVSMKISAEDGLLSDPFLTPTGGKGGVSTAPMPDALFTQDAVVVSENYLFVVNPGSNSLSLFWIDDETPWYPTLIGEPADTLGDFPVSVAYSDKLSTACVLNGGKKNGVTCFSVDKHEGLKVLDKSPRHLEELDQTTPITGPPATASDIIFNPSSTALFTIFKGNATPAFFYAYPVKHGQVSRKAVVSTIPRISLPFGAVFLGSDDKMMVSEVVFGYAIMDISSKLEVTMQVGTIVPDQMALCWAVYSPKFDNVYLMDVLVNRITVADPKTAALKTFIPFEASAAGAFDAAINRQWLYTLGRDTSVVVIDLVHEREVQIFDLPKFGPRVPWEGMAIFPSTRE